MLRHLNVTLLSIASALLPGVTHATPLNAPNPVEISPLLITSGQPTQQALALLGSQGFQAVIYLAPSSASDAVKDEPDLLKRQGIEFIHIAIPFNAPTEEHAVAVSEELARLKGKKVLVHCQVNMRASTMVFLYRVVTLKEEPAQAYEAVSRVWSPEGAWRTLIVDQLRKHKIVFQPL